MTQLNLWGNLQAGEAPSGVNSQPNPSKVPYLPTVPTLSATYQGGITVEPLSSAYITENTDSIIHLLNQLTDAPAVSSTELSAFVEALSQAPRLHRIFGAFSASGELQGVATLFIEQKLLRGAALCGHIEDVVIDSEARGKGLGRILVEHLLKVSSLMGSYKTILDCSDDNVAFYQRCGLIRKENEMVQYHQH